MRPVLVPFFVSHLGCPQRCVFCDQEKIAGARGVLPGAGEMLDKIARYRASSPGRELEVAFYGGTFTALPRDDQQYLLAALQPLLASGYLSSLRLSTRPDAVDRETASFLMEMGVGTVELGVQSMHDEVLRLSGRVPASFEASLSSSGRAPMVACSCSALPSRLTLKVAVWPEATSATLRVRSVLSSTA